MSTITDIDTYLDQHEQKDLLRFLTAGSVDDGKSTLIGRLLFDSKMIYEDQLAAVQRDSAIYGTTGDDFDPALLTDGLKAEREQGITIDVAYRYFSTDRRNFIIADTPGHEQYTRNMATGASNCDLAVILVDARHGVLPQTRRHSFIAALLGIRHLVVAINKMDAIDYNQAMFDAICRDYAGFAAKLEVADIHFIPVSALKGDNVVHESGLMPWYKGGSLLNYLETVHISSDRNLIDLRFPVQYVLHPHSGFRGYCGAMASGVMRKGDELMVLPSGRRTHVESLVTFDGELDEAFAPMSVTVTLTDEVDVSRGDMLVHLNNVPHVGRDLDAILVWMNETPLTPGKRYQVKSCVNSAPGVVRDIVYRFDIDTLHRESGNVLEMNDIGRVRLQLHRTVCFDAYQRNRNTGAFILIDEIDNATLAAGMILDRDPNELIVHDQTHTGEKRAVHPRISAVSLDERIARWDQRPITVWFTGLPRSGKSTLAFALEKRLFEQGRLVHVLDGENLRLSLSSDLGFSADDRSENLRRAADIARLCNEAGMITLAAFVSPYAADREKARQTIGAEHFIEVFLDAPLEVLEQRDEEGLYNRARSGELKTFSGITAPYEAPTRPELHLATADQTIDQCLDKLMTLLYERGVLR